MSPTNIFVLAMTDEQRRELETVRGAEDLTFHNLLDYDRAVGVGEIDFESLLAEARAELDAFDGSVDAIIAHWDFPSSIIGPVLAAERGLPAPSLKSLLASEHKYWSRLAQRECVPECVPGFVAFDPFDDDALAHVRTELAFPFWVKPVKAHSSMLGFKVTSDDDFRQAQEEIRASIEGMGDAFNAALRMVDVPDEVGEAGGNTCLAEQFVEGVQAAPEGTVFRGEFRVHGLFDMHKDEAGTSFDRLDYPAGSVPEHVQERMIDLSRRYLEHVGFDDGCFNAEFMWDESDDQLWLVEVNTRISQSHSDLFAKVDGGSNHEVAIDIARGITPRMPHREGDYTVAGQCMVFHDEDAVVTRVPDDEDMERIRGQYPDVRFVPEAAVGDRLSELAGQDSYRHIVGKLYIGADSHDELGRLHKEIAAILPFEYEEPED